VSPGEEYQEWADGWRQAADDDSRHTLQDRQRSPDYRRGYGDYWQHKHAHPGRYEDWNIILDVPSETRKAAEGSPVRLGWDFLGSDWPF
jgi:hypothetical protein